MPTAAAKPEARTITVVLPAPFTGWTAEFKADFSTRIYLDLTDADRTVGQTLEALDAIIVSHNFPNADGEVAASLFDVDPFDAIGALIEAFVTEWAAVPKRRG